MIDSKNILTAIDVLGAKVAELESELAAKQYTINHLKGENEKLRAEHKALNEKLVNYISHIADEIREG